MENTILKNSTRRFNFAGIDEGEPFTDRNITLDEVFRFAAEGSEMEAAIHEQVDTILNIQDGQTVHIYLICDNKTSVNERMCQGILHRTQ